MAYMTENAAPTDLIPIAEGERLVGHTRQWMKTIMEDDKPRVTIYRIGIRDYVSRSELLAAKKDYDTPRPRLPKDGKDDGD